VYINGFILSASYLRDCWNLEYTYVQPVMSALHMNHMT